MFTFPLSIETIILVSSKDNCHVTNLGSKSSTHDNVLDKTWFRICALGYFATTWLQDQLKSWIPLVDRPYVVGFPIYSWGFITSFITEPAQGYFMWALVPSLVLTRCFTCNTGFTAGLLCTLFPGTQRLLGQWRAPQQLAHETRTGWIYSIQEGRSIVFTVSIPRLAPVLTPIVRLEEPSSNYSTFAESPVGGRRGQVCCLSLWCLCSSSLVWDNFRVEHFGA